MSEIELKFEVTSDDLKRLAKHPAFLGKADKATLTSVYFDTADNDLRDAGLTLRVRRKAGRYLQTVKRSKGEALFDRDEWESPIAGKAPDLTLLADTPAASRLEKHAGDLAARFTTKIQRAARLYRHGEALIEVCVDKGEIVGAPGAEPIHEVELELKEGGPQELYSLAREMAEMAPIRLAFDSKSERGYRLIAGELNDPRAAESLSSSGETTTAAAFACVARACLIQLAGNAEALRRERRMESLHQARIGLRRLRSAMIVFKPVVADTAFDGLKAELRWASGELDLARDLDVFLVRVKRAAAEDQGLAAYVERLQQARVRAYDRALDALASPRFADLLLDAALWIADGPWRHDSEPKRAAARDRPVEAFAADVLDDLCKAVRKAGKDLRKLDPHVRHKLRIKAKKLRYAAEFFERAFDVPDRRRRKFIAQLKALQDALGDLNDIAIAEQTALHGVFGRHTTDLAFIAGQWVGGLKAHEPKLLDKAQDAYADFKDARPFWRG